MTDLPFTLLPVDETVSPDDDLAAAVASALDDLVPSDDPAPEPYGRSWLFDPIAGSFVKSGQGVAEVTGLDALALWCKMTVYTARFAYAVFSDQYGVDEPESPIGELLGADVIANTKSSIVQALLVHDRIAAVAFTGDSFDPATGIMDLGRIDVTTDEGIVTLTDIQLDRSA